MIARLAIAALLSLPMVYCEGHEDTSNVSSNQAYRADRRCGPYYGWAPCKQEADAPVCCSNYSWCGTSEGHCAWDGEYEHPDTRNKTWTPALYPYETATETYPNASPNPAPSDALVQTAAPVPAPTLENATPSGSSDPSPPTSEEDATPSESSDSPLPKYDLPSVAPETPCPVTRSPDNYYVGNTTNTTTSPDGLYNITNSSTANNHSGSYPTDKDIEDDYHSAARMPALSLVVIGLAVLLL